MAEQTPLEMFAYTPSGHISGKLLQVIETATVNLDAFYTYDNEAKIQTVQYPNGGPLYTYSYDSMHRPIGMVDASNEGVTNVQYNVASQLTSMTTFSVNQGRSYNSMGQLTGFNSITYNYPTNGTNNGKISSAVISGETISYQYDSLNRLQSATSGQAGSNLWSETYGYDGFGNLVSKNPWAASGVPMPPTLLVGVDPTTNRVVGPNYDANGNQLGSGLSYDAENRLVTAPGSVQYGYDSQNKRVWSVVLQLPIFR